MVLKEISGVVFFPGEIEIVSFGKKRGVHAEAVGSQVQWGDPVFFGSRKKLPDKNSRNPFYVSLFPGQKKGFVPCSKRWVQFARCASIREEMIVILPLSAFQMQQVKPEPGGSGVSFLKSEPGDAFE